MSAATVLDELRAAGLTVRAKANQVILSPRERVTPALLDRAKAHKPAILASLVAADTFYDRGRQRLAEILANKWLIPEPTVSSLAKYFPPLTGALPASMSAEKASEWRELLPYYRGLVERLGRTGEVLPGLVRAVEMWEHLECAQASVEEWDNARKKFGLPEHAAWYREAITQWKEIQAASRAQIPKKRSTPRSRYGSPAPPPPPSPLDQHPELARLWEPASPAQASQSLAADPEHLLEKLEDPTYAARYADAIGIPISAEAFAAAVKASKEFDWGTPRPSPPCEPAPPADCEDSGEPP